KAPRGRRPAPSKNYDGVVLGRLREFVSPSPYRSWAVDIDPSTRRARIGCLWMPLGCAQFGCLAALLLVAIPLLVWGGVRYGWAAAGTLVAGSALSGAGIWLTQSRLAQIVVGRRHASVRQIRLLTGLTLLFMVMPFGVVLM